MDKFLCAKCQKGFKYQSQLTQHNQRKTPCIKDIIPDNNGEEQKRQQQIEIKVKTKINKIKDNNNTENNVIKPILKWVGGKTQILNIITAQFPKNMNNYREIFIGGGSVLLGLINEIKNGNIKLAGQIYVYDINEPLIYLYKNIQMNHEQLYEEIQVIIQQYQLCKDNDVTNRDAKTIEEAMKSKENYYYWLRKLFNQLDKKEKKGVKGSALFIFLNKTCFRGVFREGPNGFNVPYGNYKNPEVINKEHLFRFSQAIQQVHFICDDYQNSLSIVQKGDFVYLDPPYLPEKKESFVQYDKLGFNMDQHLKLFSIIQDLTYKNVNFLLSNSDVPLIREQFADKQYNIEQILCKRAINSKNPEKKTIEVLIKNY